MKSPIAQPVLALTVASALACNFGCAPKSDPSAERQDSEGRAESGPVHPSGRLGAALEGLRGAGTSIEAKQGLSELEAYLRSLPREEAVAALIASLDEGEDLKLPIGFELGADGFLTGHPSWRAALLDWLGKIDPQAAAEYSKTVLGTPTTADEWAIAMRNYARGTGEPDSATFLQAKVVEMIDHPQWKSDPSRGYFEAFDVFVHTRAVGSTPMLSSLVGDVSPGGKPLAHAAFLTLDRLTQAAPEEMYAALAKQEQLFESRGPMVANFFARADLRQESQRQQVEGYLLDPRRTPEELEAFAGVYPNNNQMISHNLLTKSDTPAGAELVAHDRAALAIVNNWLDDRRFADPKVKPHIQTMQRRLAGFVRQASGG